MNAKEFIFLSYKSLWAGILKPILSFFNFERVSLAIGALILLLGFYYYGKQAVSFFTLTTEESSSLVAERLGVY